MQNDVNIDLKKGHTNIIFFFLLIFLAYWIGKYISTNDPIKIQLIIICFLLIIIGLRWTIVTIPIIIILYSGLFGNLIELPRFNFLTGGLHFQEAIILFYIGFNMFVKKDKILRTPITKAVFLLLSSALVSIIFTHLSYGLGWHTLLMNQRNIFLYSSVWLFLGIMDNNKNFYHANYAFLALSIIFLLLNLSIYLFPGARQFIAYSTGGDSIYVGLRRIEDFGARRFFLPSDGIVYYGLSFFFFMIILKPFKKYRIWPYIFSLLAFISLLLSFTRGYWICIPLSILLVMVYVVVKHQLYDFKFFSLFVFLFLTIIAMAVFLSVQPSLYNALLVRLWQTKIDLIQVSGTWESRILEAKSGLSVIRGSPIFGGGNFIKRYYGATVFPGVHFGFEDVYINYGLLGLISFLLFLIIPIKQFIQNKYRISTKIDFWIATSSICYLLIFMIISFYSSQFYHPVWVLSFCFSATNLNFLERKYKETVKKKFF